jgi:hypothetical protein
MEQEISKKISMDNVRQAVRHHFESFFGFDMVSTDLSELDHLLNPDVALIT